MWRYEVHVALIEEVITRPSVHGLPDVHGLIVAIRDAELAAPILRQAVDAGIVVVVANSDLQSFPTPIHAVVGYSQRGANRAMGDYAGRLSAGRTMQVGLIEGAPGYHSTEAVSGFREGLAEHAHLTVVGSEQGDWSVEGGKKAAETLLREHQDIDLIWAANDNMIMGARLATDAAGRSDILLLGRDGDPDALQMVSEGELTATVDTDPAAIGAASVRVVAEALAGRFHGGFVETPTIVVDSDTTAQTPTDR
ncbi:sugar ABC transporter substrate-binding protein [Algihabitans albus]|uniref:sugar ABC transporter substrate-binding protein n=1 Tax=Algihabitans albus TaxID=2164067 RepID=UPI000E5CF5AA|nr:sugar ABC transporter substrate-binding protein [Algihabitans albus]